MWKNIGKDGETSTAAYTTTTTMEFCLPIAVDCGFLPMLQPCSRSKDGKST
jgi:hypothetical protein